MNNLLSRLLALINGGGVLQVLKDILARVLQGESLPDAEAEVEAYLNKRLDAQAGRTSAKELAYATLKQIENAMSPDAHGKRPAGMTADQQIAIGMALAQNAALQYAATGEAALKLAEAHAALERVRGTVDEAAARSAREAAEEAYKASAVNIARVSAGAAPLGHA